MSSQQISRLDQIYRSFVLSKFFSRGWGCPDNLKRLFEFRKLIANRELCLKLVDPNHTISVDKVQFDETGEYKLIDGHFRSPIADHLPGILPKVAENAYFQMLVPKEWNSADRPLCIQMAGTGDHHFWRRRNLLAKPLLKEHGIASLILENPFYGLRKPQEQFRSNLLNVSDIFVMGGALILEAIAILRWCDNEGFGPYVIHGISMGGHMASLAAGSWEKPICLVPCLSWSTASGVFTQGVMSEKIDWKSLENQFNTIHVYKDEFYKLVWNDDDVAYQAGKDFVSQYVPTPIATISKTTDGVDQGKNSLFQVLTTFLRDRGLLKILPTLQQDASSAKSISSSSEVAGKVVAIQKSLPIPVNGESEIGKNKGKVQKEAIQFMRGVMDEFTHLKNYSKPLDPELIIVVAAKNDGYVPREGFTPLDEIWPGCDVRFIDCGHISAYVLHQGLFKKTIAEVVDRYRQKYNCDGTVKSKIISNPAPSAAAVVEEVLRYKIGKTSSDPSPQL